MKKVGTILNEAVKKGTLLRSVRLGEIWLGWERIAGTEIAAHTRPLKVVGRRLYVEVDSAAIQHKVSFVKDDILGRVQATTGGRYVLDIVFHAHPKAEVPSKAP